MAILNELISGTAAVLSIGLAVFIFFKDRRSLVHQIFAAGMTALGIIEGLAGLGSAASPAEMARLGPFYLSVTAFLPGIWLLFSLSYGRSNYRELLAKWKGFVIAAFLFPFFLVTFFKESLFVMPSTEEVSGSTIPLGGAGYVFYLFFLIISVIILMNLEGTLRASSGSKRWQIKFMVLGLGGLFAVEVYTISQILLFSSFSLALQSVNSYAVAVADLFVIFSLLRHRLLNVDIYLSRDFLYHSITVVVIGSYLLAVGILAKVIRYYGGDQILPLGTFFVFLSMLGLAVILLSDQLRQEIRRFITRNFYRPQYDYRREWTAFTQRTTSLVDVKDLCSAVSKMVSETFGVPSVTIWLLDEAENQISLGGSTVYSSIQIRDLKSGETGSGDLVGLMRDHSMPIDFNKPIDTRAKKLKERYPDYFEHARVRYCVSLAAGQRLLGIMTLNDRLTKEPFSLEDFDLLKTIADQAAGSLLNLNLSQRLLKAKEMEVFQTLSAFFIHDLKNLASTLSLTLQNLPVHFDNPEFRKETFRAISQSVAKMNAMCSRLSLLTKTLDLQQREEDLNEVISGTLIDLNGSMKASVVQELTPLPKLSIDRTQVEKVLLNLILNANEAVAPGGEIRIGTRPTSEHGAILSITDNGCGMSREFLSRSLFQPFQTTKSEGLGIGLFHSKKIIEAHRGKIEVESEEGRGTTFRVIFPASDSNDAKSKI